MIGNSSFRCSQCSAPLLGFVLLEVLPYFLDRMPEAQRTMSDRELGSWRECTRIRAANLPSRSQPANRDQKYHV